MFDYVLYYVDDLGQKGSISFATGDTYDTVSDFIDEFKFDHPDYVVAKVKEEA